MPGPLHSKDTPVGRVYIDPVTGVELRSVTAVIERATSAPYLRDWAVRLAAERAVSRYGELGDRITLDGEEAATEWLKQTSYDATRAAAHNGTVFHEWVTEQDSSVQDVWQRLMDTEEAHRRPTLTDISTILRMREQYLTLARRWKIEILWQERTGFNRALGFGGTGDVCFSSPYLHEGHLLMGDYKTSNGAKPRQQVGPQLKAYTMFEGLWRVEEDGTVTEEPMTPVLTDVAYVIKVKPTKASLHRIDLTGADDLWRAMLLVSDWYGQGSKRVSTALKVPEALTASEVLEMLHACDSVEALEEVWRHATVEGVWSEELTEAASNRKRAITS